MTSRFIALAWLTGLIVLTTLIRSAVAAEPRAGDKPVVGAAMKMSVLLVTDGNPLLAKGIEANGVSKVRLVTPDRYAAANAGGFDVIVFDRCTPAAIPATGGLLFIDALPPGGVLKQSVDGKGSPVTIAAPAVKDWKKDHPAMKTFTAAKLYVERARKLDVPKGWTTLLDGDKGPLIVAERDGTHRRQIVVAFDVTKSNWPLRASFPTFVSDATQYLAGR
jgi:hypothetical protein